MKLINFFRDQDPWGKPSSNDGKAPQDNNNQNNPPDLEEIIKNILKSFGIWQKNDSNSSNGNDGSSGENNGFSNSKRLLLLFLAAVVVWAGSGFYTVREAERGVVTRFGKLNHIAFQGLNWKMTFIDNVYHVNIERISQLSSSGAMLTQDENMVEVEMTVQYRIENPSEYLFNVVNPDVSLKQATDSALRYVIGHMTMDDILTTGRSTVREKTWALLRDIIQNYNMGLSVVDVNFQAARPPEQVKEAFDDAIKAQEDEQRLIREAEAYARGREPIARGIAQQIVEQGAAYKDKVVLEAQGETSRFLSLLPEYKANPRLMRERLYLQTVEKIMQNNPKVLLDADGNQVTILPLEQFLKKTQNANEVVSLQPLETPKFSQTQPVQNIQNLTTNDRERVGRFK